MNTLVSFPEIKNREGFNPRKAERACADMRLVAAARAVIGAELGLEPTRSTLAFMTGIDRGAWLKLENMLPDLTPGERNEIVFPVVRELGGRGLALSYGRKMSGLAAMAGDWQAGQVKGFPGRIPSFCQIRRGVARELDIMPELIAAGRRPKRHRAVYENACRMTGVLLSGRPCFYRPAYVSHWLGATVEEVLRFRDDFDRRADAETRLSLVSHGRKRNG